MEDSKENWQRDLGNEMVNVNFRVLNQSECWASLGNLFLKKGTNPASHIRAKNERCVPQQYLLI